MGRIIKRAAVKKPEMYPNEDKEPFGSAAPDTSGSEVEVATPGKREIIDLALTIARRVVGRAVETDASVLESIYRQALEAARDLADATVYVHPDDRALFSAEELVKESGFELVSSDEVGRAGCRIVSGKMEIDARLDTVLGAIGNALKGDI